MEAGTSLVVATYNVLASAYIQRARYPRSPAMVLSPAWRIPALVQAIASLEADILCLQEVEPETLAAINARLCSRGYASRYARKRGGSPEGCAIFYREDLASLKEETVVVFAPDGGMGDRGNIAQIVTLWHLGPSSRHHQYPSDLGSAGDGAGKSARFTASRLNYCARMKRSPQPRTAGLSRAI